MIKRISFSILLTFSFCIQLSSQTISGSIIDKSDNDVVPFAVVKLYKESIKIKESLSDVNGSFSFSQLKPGNYVLVTKYIGLDKDSTQITLADQDIKLKVLMDCKGCIRHVCVEYPVNQKETSKNILSYIVDTKLRNLELYWKNDTGGILKSINNLKNYVEGKGSTLVFAMNGGMYMQDNSPLGLFIYDHKQIRELNMAKSDNGNFYLKPNGVFYLNEDNSVKICTSEAFKSNNNIKYATQSGPMLVIDGKIHSAFKEGSSNLNIRNGVGVLPDGKLIFAMSKNSINFYDFAKFFKDMGCANALYLDGFVSRTYLPEENWRQLDGNFGVMIGVTKPKEK